MALSPGESLHQRKIAEDFFLLQDRANQLFTVLRDLPDYGNQWESHYAKAFEVYTKLWKYQQMHRVVLENKSIYGLKRWEVGEIATRVGELYFHYYLRTSDVNYLNEAFLFFDAIRSRAYFKGVAHLRSLPVMVLKLRYYARFIVVALLMNRTYVVKELVHSITRQVNAYMAFKPPDVSEWQTALQEITLFIQADHILFIRSDSPRHSKVLAAHSVRRTHAALLQKSSSPPLIEGQDAPRTRQLRTAVVVSNRAKQVKFSELTLDAYRMILALEPVAVQTNSETLVVTVKQLPDRIRKFLLYRPTACELIASLTSAMQSTPEDDVLMLYLSADAVAPLSAAHEDEDRAQGGLAMRARDAAKGQSPSALEADALYPADLVTVLRCPAVVIVDSPGSTVFAAMRNPFQQPRLVLCSPSTLPETLPDPSSFGALFTTFLHSPLDAFCFLVSQTELTRDAHSKCGTLLAEMHEKLMEAIVSADLPPLVAPLVEVPLVRLFLARFCFCYTVMSLHLDFSSIPGGKALPHASPDLPASLLAHAAAVTTVDKLAQELNVTRLFHSPQPAAQ